MKHILFCLWFCLTMQHVKKKRFGHGIFSQVNTFIAKKIKIDFVGGGGGGGGFMGSFGPILFSSYVDWPYLGLCKEIVWVRFDPQNFGAKFL